MTYDARTRDRYRHAVLAVTATAGAAAIAATGWLTGAAAHQQAQQDAQQQAQQDADARAAYDAWVARYGDPAGPQRTVLRERPTRTRVSTTYVTGAPSQPAVGAGGTVSRATTAQQPAPGSAAPAAQPPPQPPPPPPPPPPAPSHGS